MRNIVLAVSVVGMLLFGGALALSWFDPLSVERLARDVVRIEVERQVAGHIAAPDQVPARVAQVAARMLGRDCECRKRLAALLHPANRLRLSLLPQSRERLTRIIESSYASAAGKLLREFRIVTGSNALAFAALGLTALARRRTALQLLLPALVLMTAVLFTGAMYLFQQDWLRTLVYGDYVGGAYAAYLAVVVALLADLALNRARMTSQILSALGAVPLAIPC